MIIWQAVVYMVRFNNKMNILILSCGTRNKIVQYFKHELNGSGNVIAADCWELAPALYEADKHFIVPKINDEKYLDIILKICQEENVKGVLSLIDPELSLLSKNRDRFEKIGVSVFVSDYEVVETCFDKGRMFDFCRVHSINTVPTYKSLSEFIGEYTKEKETFPVFVKPIHGSCSVQAQIVTDIKTLELLCEREPEMMIQRLMKGQEYGIDVYTDLISKKVTSVFVKKKLLMRAGVVCSKRLLNQAVGKSLRTHNLKPKKGAQVMRKNEKITALYERLSRDDFGKDDDQQRESNSISNQKAMLEEFAARQGFTNIVHFTDDGISGTCFDRPGFLAMMKEVEAGNVEYLCIKDMSRMGRDYLKVGQIMEILRQRGVRLIAINDGVDSARGDDDFTPFRNIMNEYYARDTSRKIRSTFQSKGKSGKHLTGTVIYGYLWNEARDQWLVDPEAAEVVKRIFAMTIEGYGPYQIASKLKEEKILIPSAYLAQHGEGVNKNKTFKDVYGWGSSTICNLLEKREYLGHTINFKTRKHFKDKKSHYVPEDEWTIFENTHEAIIDQQTFDLVQKIRGNVRRYPDGWGEAAPLTGLLYCADCGGKMYVHRTNNGKRISQYTCSQYSKVPVGKLCTTQHRINEDVVLSLVSEMLKAIAEYAKHDRAEFVRVVQEAQSSQQTAEVRKQRTRLATAKQRVSELEVLLCKIYEDNILGKLSDSRYATLDAQYEKEQSELTAEISVLEKAVKSYEKHEKDADRFIALIGKYENFDKLTIAMLNEFIEKILVHERDRKGSIQTTQEVEIYFNFVGRFVPPAFGEVELTPEELEEIRKREERKDRLHQNYLKRKASGAQKRYEDKIKERKKAEIEAEKAGIRAEDIAKGVFVPVSSLPQREPMKGVQTA